MNVVSISGGKDSTAMWLLALERDTPNMEVVFCDVGHEHPKTYEYIDYLEKELGTIRKIKANFDKEIEWKRKVVQDKWRHEGVSKKIIDDALEVLKPTGIPFLDLCLWKSRFPFPLARFCTQELKSRPMLDQVHLPLLEKNEQVVSWQGIRADESLARSKLLEREGTLEGIEIYRPILKWTVEDVFAMHEKHGVKPNPLYLEGMSRVGCMPCINSNKNDIYEIAKRYPEEIDRLRLWEELVNKASKQGRSSFFTHGKKGKGIDEAVKWSKTAHGGKQFDLFKTSNEITCSSIYGLCE